MLFKHIPKLLRTKTYNQSIRRIYQLPGICRFLFHTTVLQSRFHKPKIRNRAVDKHSFIADPYPAVLLNPDPDPDPAT